MQDDELIKQAQAGNENAFSQLVDRHYEIILRVAYQWCGNREDAEDIAQQACIKLARNLSQFRFESAFTTWLYRLVINCAKDWYKSQSRHQPQRSDHDDSLLRESAQASPADHQIFLRQILHRVDNLAQGMKETLLLVHGQGCSHREAADILGVKESTISWRLHEMRKYLQSLLEKGDV